jgi:hypothetical protein
VIIVFGSINFGIEQLYSRYRLYKATTIRTLVADGLPENPSIEEQ